MNSNDAKLLEILENLQAGQKRIENTVASLRKTVDPLGNTAGSLEKTSDFLQNTVSSLAETTHALHTDVSYLKQNSITRKDLEQRFDELEKTLLTKNDLLINNDVLSTVFKIELGSFKKEIVSAINKAFTQIATILKTHNDRLEDLENHSGFHKN